MLGCCSPLSISTSSENRCRSARDSFRVCGVGDGGQGQIWPGTPTERGWDGTWGRGWGGKGRVEAWNGAGSGGSVGSGIAGLTGCRPRIPGPPPQAAKRTRPSWAWGRPLDPLLDTSDFIQPSPGTLSSIAPLWPPGQAMGREGAPRGWQQAGSRQADGQAENWGQQGG